MQLEKFGNRLKQMNFRLEQLTFMDMNKAIDKPEETIPPTVSKAIDGIVETKH